MVKVPIVSHCLARGKLTGRKSMKRRKKKTDGLQKGVSIARGLTGCDCIRVYSHF